MRTVFVLTEWCTRVGLWCASTRWGNERTSELFPTMHVMFADLYDYTLRQFPPPPTYTEHRVRIHLAPIPHMSSDIFVWPLFCAGLVTRCQKCMRILHMHKENTHTRTNNPEKESKSAFFSALMSVTLHRRLSLQNSFWLDASGVGTLDMKWNNVVPEKRQNRNKRKRMRKLVFHFYWHKGDCDISLRCSSITDVIAGWMLPACP